MKIRSIIKTLLFGMLLLTASCSEEVTNELVSQPQTGEPVTLRMSIDMPETGMATRAMDDGTAPTITSLWVAVFTQDHYLKQVAEAVPVRTDDQGHFLPADDNDPHRLTYFDVTLNTTDQNVIIHLIANYDLSTLPFGQEGQIIGSLEVSGNKDVYWQRIPSVPIKIELDNDGNYTSQMIDATAMPKVIQAPDELVEVPLVRNYAMVELELAPTVTNFEVTGFALTNMPDRGSVAPRINQNTFANYYDGAKRNATCKSYANILAQGYKGNDPYGVEHSEEQEYTSFGNAIYTYEFNNDRDELSTMSMIIKGRYGNDANDTYYKVDLTYEDANNVTHYYHVLRNFKYKVQIKRLIGSGYETEEDAMQRPACNNISGSTLVSSLTNVSNGEYQLYVDNMDLVMVHNNTYQLKYRFVDLANMNTVNNRISIISSGCTGTGHVLASAPQKTGTDGDWQILTLTPNNPANQAMPLIEELILVDNDTKLMRKIKLTLRRPYTMKVELTPSTVPQTYNCPVTVSVYIPTGLESSTSMFPLSFYIDSQNNTLYPQANTDMPVVVNHDGTYSFLKEIRQVDYEQLPIVETTVNIGGQTITQPMRRIDCYFMTNALQSGTTVHVNNTYFNQGEATLTTGTAGVITNVNIVGTEYYGAGHSLTLKYTLSNNINYANNLTITLNDGTQTVTYNDANTDWTAGVHEVKMKTVSFSDDVSFTITATYNGNTQTITVPNPKKRHVLLIPKGSFRITDTSVLNNYAIERSGDSYYWARANNYEWPDYHLDGIDSGSGRINGGNGNNAGTTENFEIDATYGGRVQQFTESTEFVFTTYYNYGSTQPTINATIEEYNTRAHELPKKYAVLTVGDICNSWVTTGGENGGYINLVLNFSETMPASLGN